MVYQVPESKRSIEQNRFHFNMPDGSSVSIPKAKYLKMGQLEALASNPKEVDISELLELFGDQPTAAAAVRDLDHEQLTDLMQAWQADSGLTLGESVASE